MGNRNQKRKPERCNCQKLHCLLLHDKQIQEKFHLPICCQNHFVPTNKLWKRGNISLQERLTNDHFYRAGSDLKLPKIIFDK